MQRFDRSQIKQERKEVEVRDYVKLENSSEANRADVWKWKGNKETNGNRDLETEKIMREMVNP